MGDFAKVNFQDEHKNVLRDHDHKIKAQRLIYLSKSREIKDYGTKPKQAEDEITVIFT